MRLVDARRLTGWNFLTEGPGVAVELVFAPGEAASVVDDVLALLRDEVDAVFGDKVQLWLWGQKPEGKCCEVVGQDVKDTQTLGIGVSAGLRREDIKLREALNKAFGEMMTDGTYKKINDKYFPFPLN